MEEIYRSIQDVISPEMDSEAAALVEERIAIVVHKLQFIPDHQRPKVSYVRDSLNTHFVQEDYLDQVIRLAGGIPQTDPMKPDFAPEILLVISQKAMPTLLSEIPNALMSGVWPQTSVVKNNHVYIIHHPDYLQVPGRYPADEVEILAEIINPGYFVYGRQDDAWLQFNLQLG